MLGMQVCGSGSVVERCLAKANVAGSSPVFRSKMVPSPSGKAKVCKTFIPRFKSGWYLQKRLLLEVAVFIKRLLQNILISSFGLSTKMQNPPCIKINPIPPPLNLQPKPSFKKLVKDFGAAVARAPGNLLKFLG